MNNIDIKKTFYWLEDTSIKNLISVLNNNGNHQFRFVGGCIRDSIINKSFYDYDVASTNTPEENIALFTKNNIKVIPTGIKHGTISAVINNKTFEITSTREDVSTNGRHASIEFSKDFLKDSSRRDFTFNAIYLDPLNLTLYDYHNGINDLLNKKISFIGNPQDRIDEDYLRILRYFRFFCLYANNIDKDVLEIIKYKAPKLKTLSKERINQEFIKILTAPFPKQTLLLMEEYEVFLSLFAIDKYAFIKFENILEVEKIFNITNNLILRAAFILNDPNEANNFILKKTDLTHIKNVVSLKNFINKYKIIDYYEICNLVLNYGYEDMLHALIINTALSTNNKNHYIEIINKLIKKSKDIFPINGQDLLKLGLQENKIGFYLKKITLIFWQYPLKTKEEYLEIIKNWINLDNTI